MKGRDQAPPQQSIFPGTAFNISSAEDFPSLAQGEAPRSSLGGGNKQKRRIRPTPLNESDMPIEGDITAFGASASPTFDRMSSATAGRMNNTFTGNLQGNIQRVGLTESLPPSLKAVETPWAKAFENKKEVTGNTVSRASSLHAPMGMHNTANLAQDHKVQEGADNESGVTNLREMTSGLMPETTRLAWRSYLALCTEGASFKEDVVVRGRAPATLPFTSKSKGFDMEGTVRAPKLAADFSLRGQDSFQERSTAVGTSLCSYGQGAANSSPYTPAKSFSIPRAGDEESSWSGCIPPTPPTPPPLTPTTSTTTKNGHHKTELTLPILASLYVHFMIRRLVPSLTTEIHLTVRLLHVHYDVIRGSSISSDHHHHHFLPGHCIAPSPTMAGIDYKKKGDDRSDGCTDSCINEQPKTRVVFKTGRDCRLFAASVLLGLKPLLPHIGTEALDLLAGSLALASESEERIEEARHVLCQARGESGKAIGNGKRSLGQQNADDTAIVQSVGAPFAALQWREEDSVNHCRTLSDRALFQNRQESVDRFGSLLREYQGSKKGLQQYPERSLQQLRTATSALICGLAPDNFRWLARYFLAQLIGWGIAPPEETDSEVMALVAPAGEKGRATLQKLHRRISTPSSGESANASKSSRKLRHPGTHPRQMQANGDQGLYDVGGTRGSRTGGQQLRSRKSGPRHGEGRMPLNYVRVPAAPLQLCWFPGNQEFFYHVLLALDSHSFNSHLKTEFAAEIDHLYYQQTAFEKKLKDSGQSGGGVGGVSEASKSNAGEWTRSFTGTIVKLKVLAKFLGLLTFYPNWGVPPSDMAPIRHQTFSVKSTICPLPLDTYLEHAWSTEGLVGAIPWIADFLRMMKWDKVSSQADFYSSIFAILASLHGQPCMRPDHPAFTECLLAVSCEVEALFQDLGFDLGVMGYRLSSALNTSTALNSLGACGSSDSRLYQTSGSRQPPFSTLKASKPKTSLDVEVILSRRLIQNCCTYLEDVLTLIESLDRAWKLESVDGRDGTPFRANRSPRIIGAVGANRGKRIIKPHSLRPLPVLPSVPEQHQRSENRFKTADKAQGSIQKESARLRLVEAFFHPLPDELQVTADFVVMRAVQNACEEVLTAVVRPAVTVTISRLEGPSNQGNLTSYSSPACMWPAANTLPIGSSTAGTGTSRQNPNRPKIRHEQEIAWVTATLQQVVGAKARSLAGRKGLTIAKTTTLSLVSHALPLRVRETAAAIAGHHAQQAAERKIKELMAVVVSEAVTAYHVNIERNQKDKKQEDSSRLSGRLGQVQKDKNVGTPGNKDLFLQGSLPTSPWSRLPALLSALISTAKKLGARFGEEDIMQAANRVSTDGVDDIQAMAIILRETLQLVRAVRRRLLFRVREDAESILGSQYAGGEIGCTKIRTEELQRTQAPSFRGQETQRAPKSLERFLNLLARVWRSLYGSYNSNHYVVQALRAGFNSMPASGDAFGDLVHLTALAWEEAIFFGRGDKFPPEKSCMPPHKADVSLGGPFTLLSQWGVCIPALELMAWGVVSVMVAENTLLSCMQGLKTKSPKRRSFSTDIKLMKGGNDITASSPDALVLVLSGITKGYHSLAVEEDLSAVLLVDLLDVAAKSLSRRHLDAKPPQCYHSLDLCRLVARLVAV